MVKPIFADFEGNKKRELFLLSVRHVGLTTTYILDERLAPLADSKLAKDFNLVVMDAEQAINLLVNRCRDEMAPLAAYSQTEKDTLKESFDIEVSDYLDMRKLARKWINKYHRKEFEQLPTYKPKSKDRQDKSATWSLMAIAKWLDLGLPGQYARGKVTKRINTIISGFAARGADYGVLTRTQKIKAGNLLKHSAFDVEGLEKLFEIISAEDASLVKRILDG
jgi:hypothetical protein